MSRLSNIPGVLSSGCVVQECLTMAGADEPKGLWQTLGKNQMPHLEKRLSRRQQSLLLVMLRERERPCAVQPWRQIQGYGLFPKG
ncbi:hypothetical protein CapIbe_016341 [Capra ibex]